MAWVGSVEGLLQASAGVPAVSIYASLCFHAFVKAALKQSSSLERER